MIARRRALIVTRLRTCGLLFFVAVLAAVTGGTASAQPKIQVGPPPGTSNDAPPVAVGPGWRYERRPPDIHMFLCQLESCDRSSRVSYRVYAPNNKTTLAQFRAEQEALRKALEERGPPGTRIEILGIDGDEGGKLPRMYKSRRVMTSADGSKEYSVSALLLGSRYSASLISSSRSEKASTANHAIFGIAVLLLVSLPEKPGKAGKK